MVDWLLPGEVLIKDSGSFPITFDKTLVGLDGKLYLTNMRLVFQPNKFQDLFTRLMGLHKLIVEIPLHKIRSVESSLGYLTVYTDRKYDFRMLKKNDDWLALINKARKKQLNKNRVN